MKILAIESSCDESAAAVIQDGRRVLSSVVATQIKTHQPYSGVVPELASREHVLQVNRVIAEALKKAGIRSPGRDLDAIAVTVGPGLVGSLLVGRMTAEAMGWIHDLPVYGVNHIEGHLLSSLLLDRGLDVPFLGLVVSGGHTELIYAQSWGRYHLLGRTRDDAAGEAFDKVAKMLNLGYPGGPEIDRMAKRGTASRFRFPRAWLPGTWDFSFSGLKTAVLYRLREKKRWTLQEKRDLCAGFQESVIDVLVEKSVAAARALKINRLVVGGGVAANSQLRQALQSRAKREKISLRIASPELCTDNAAMIGCAAYFQIRRRGATAPRTLKIEPQMRLPFFSRIPSQFSPPAVVDLKRSKLKKHLAK